MSSRKRRPIVMNRHKTPGRTNSIIKNVLWLTAFLALVEVVILVVVHFKNANKAEVKAFEKPKELLHAAVKDTTKNIAGVPKKAVEVSEHKDTVAKKDTVEIVKPVAEEIKPAPSLKPVRDSTIVKAVKPVKPEIVKEVSDEKMFRVLNEVRLIKMQANNPSKCVSVRIVGAGNAKNASRIASYLRTNGYVISGREVIGGSQKGIHVDASGTCITLAIGDL